MPENGRHGKENSWFVFIDNIKDRPNIGFARMKDCRGPEIKRKGKAVDEAVAKGKFAGRKNDVVTGYAQHFVSHQIAWQEQACVPMGNSLWSAG